MGVLEKTIFHIRLLDWLTVVVIAVVSFVLLLLVKELVAKKLSVFASSTETKLDDLLVALLQNTNLLSIGMISVYIGTLALTLPAKADVVLQKALILTLLIQGAFWSNQLVSFWFQEIFNKRAQENQVNASARSMLNFASRLILWALALLLILDNLGFNITTLIAGLGVGGIAVALAIQNILADLFASLSIILDKPFVLGDFIIVDEYMGTVKHIGLKTTRIQSLSGEEVVFSNTDLLKSRIRNYKRMYERRVVFALGVTYQTPSEKLGLVKSILQTSIEAHHDVRFDRAHFKEFGDSALVFEAVYFVLDPDYNKFMDTQESINTMVFRRMAEEQIDFAYPTQTLLVHTSTSPANS